jgi:small subunit ribosomal protein S16
VANRAFYRIVAADSRSPRDGRHLEVLGTYDPLAGRVSKTKEVRLNVERIEYWLAMGAQPSDKVHWLFGKAGLVPLKPVPAGKPKEKAVVAAKAADAAAGAPPASPPTAKPAPEAKPQSP